MTLQANLEMVSLCFWLQALNDCNRGYSWRLAAKSRCFRKSALCSLRSKSARSHLACLIPACSSQQSILFNALLDTIDGQNCTSLVAQRAEQLKSINVQSCCKRREHILHRCSPVVSKHVDQILRGVLGHEVLEDAEVHFIRHAGVVERLARHLPEGSGQLVARHHVSRDAERLAAPGGSALRN